MAKKITTIEELATLTQAEFLTTGRRLDSLERKVDDGFKAVDNRLNDIDGRIRAMVDVIDIMRQDLHDVKVALGPLARTVTTLEEQVRELDKRVGRLEEKAAFAH